MKVFLNRNERGFYHWDLLWGSHDHKRTRIWVHRLLVHHRAEDARPYVELPLCGARVVKTEKGSLVARPTDGLVVYYVSRESGYRGWAEIKEIQGGEIVTQGEKYHSPQGTLGATAWAIVNAQGPIIVHSKATGRRVSHPDKVVRYAPDGKTEELVTDQEVFKLLE